MQIFLKFFKVKAELIADGVLCGNSAQRERRPE